MLTRWENEVLLGGRFLIDKSDPLLMFGFAMTIVFRVQHAQRESIFSIGMDTRFRGYDN